MIVIEKSFRSKTSSDKDKNKNQEEENAIKWLREDRFLKSPKTNKDLIL